jgi:hypothetical protein
LGLGFFHGKWQKKLRRRYQYGLRFSPVWVKAIIAVIEADDTAMLASCPKPPSTRTSAFALLVGAASRANHEPGSATEVVNGK